MPPRQEELMVAEVRRVAPAVGTHRVAPAAGTRRVASAAGTATRCDTAAASCLRRHVSAVTPRSSRGEEPRELRGRDDARRRIAADTGANTGCAMTAPTCPPWRVASTARSREGEEVEEELEEEEESRDRQTHARRKIKRARTDPERDLALEQLANMVIKCGDSM